MEPSLRILTLAGQSRSQALDNYVEKVGMSETATPEERAETLSFLRGWLNRSDLVLTPNLFNRSSITPPPPSFKL
jgi:hypothetical protein